MAWQIAVQASRATLMSQFLQCRLNPVLATLESIATAKFPKPRLGSPKVLPGTATEHTLGDFKVQTDESTIAGSQPINLHMDLDALSNQMGEGNSTPGRRLRS